MSSTTTTDHRAFVDLFKDVQRIQVFIMLGKYQIFTIVKPQLCLPMQMDMVHVYASRLLDQMLQI